MSEVPEIGLGAGEIDTILLLEFGTPTQPLEVVLTETKPGSPQDIRKHLEALEIRSGLFVYVSGKGIILTAEEYLNGPYGYSG